MREYLFAKYIQGSIGLLTLFKLAKWSQDFELDDVDPRARAMIESADEMSIEIENLKLFNKQSEIFLASKAKRSLIFKHLPSLSSIDKVYKRKIDDKLISKKLMKKHGLPVPEGFLAKRFSKKPIDKARQVGYPLVIKPRLGSLSQGVARGIKNDDQLKEVLVKSKQDLIVEKECRGKEYRVSLINGKFKAACYRESAKVVGDGQSSVKQLLKEKNNQRKSCRSATFKRMKIDKDNLDLNYRPKKSEVVFLNDNVNLSSGAWLYDVSKKVDKSNIAMFEKIGQIYRTDIIGIDYISPDITKSYAKVGGWIIELNSLPYINMHTKTGQKQIARDLWRQVF